MHITPLQALASLKDLESPFNTVFNHGTLQVEIYKPEAVDQQKPHSRDEVYVIVTGHGKFKNGDSLVEFAPGDFLFVKAGVEHRFIDFSEDFVTWVLFYGPEGGEKE